MRLQVLFGIIILILVIISVAVGTSLNTTTTRTVTSSKVVTITDEVSHPQQAQQGRRVSKGEAECRRVLSRIYGCPFPTVRPEWLKSTETGRNLELDCYAEVDASSLGMGDGHVMIACEYQGIQHYKYGMHSSEYEYKSQLWNDEYKKRLCEEYGVHLIIVPYTVKLNDIKDYIHRALEDRSLLPMSVRRG